MGGPQEAKWPRICSNSKQNQDIHRRSAFAHQFEWPAGRIPGLSPSPFNKRGCGVMNDATIRSEYPSCHESMGSVNHVSLPSRILPPLDLGFSVLGSAKGARNMDIRNGVTQHWKLAFFFSSTRRKFQPIQSDNTMPPPLSVSARHYLSHVTFWKEGNGPIDSRAMGQWKWPLIWIKHPLSAWYPRAYVLQEPFLWPLRPWWPLNDLEGHLWIQIWTKWTDLPMLPCFSGLYIALLDKSWRTEAKYHPLTRSAQSALARNKRRNSLSDRPHKIIDLQFKNLLSKGNYK